MARCGECNAFRATEPEITGTDANTPDGDGLVKGTADVSLNCQECGNEMATTQFDLEGELDPGEFEQEDHAGDGHDMSAEVTKEEAEEVTVGLGKKTAGVRVVLTVEVKCSCGDKTWETELETSKEKSEFDEV